MTFDFINLLTEALDPRTPHPEDAIFDGSAAAAKAVKGLTSAIAGAGNITIKWDGSPALIFGRIEGGALAVMDKYMWDAKFFATSPEDWVKYDQQKASGRLREDLYPKLQAIWAGLDAAVTGSAFYWGDLLYVGKPPMEANKYIFKQVTVTYKVPAISDLGKLITQSVGGIVVHQQFSGPDAKPQKWDGNGLQNVNGGVAIIKPDMGVKFRLKEPVPEHRAAEAAIAKYGSIVDQTFATIPKSVRDSLKTYFNKRITGQPAGQVSAADWIKAETNPKQYKSLVINMDIDPPAPGLFYTYEYDNNKEIQLQETPALFGLREIWNSIYQYKLNLYVQLEQQVPKDLEQYTNGKPGGEGFVFPTPEGLVKIVNRGQFGAAHFNK